MKVLIYGIVNTSIRNHYSIKDSNYMRQLIKQYTNIEYKPINQDNLKVHSLYNYDHSKYDKLIPH